jgi:FkbM family methyltransferase
VGNADVSWLKQGRSFPALIDIGANDGSFAGYLCRALDISRVIAFEPLASHAEALMRRGYEVHTLALGNPASLVDVAFHISGADSASSLLPLTQRCIDEYPQVALSRTVSVPLRRLDDVVAPIPGAVIKMDAQGAEADILDGGALTFGAAAIVLVEMTFVPLYEGQALFNAVHRRLDDLGFDMIGFRGQHQSATTGEPLFAHTVYRNRTVSHESQAQILAP